MQRALALLQGVDEPAGRLQPALDPVAHAIAALGLLEQLAVGRADGEFPDALVGQPHDVLAVQLLHGDVRVDGGGQDLAEFRPWRGIEGAYALDRQLDVRQRAPGDLGDARQAIGLDVLEMVGDHGAHQRGIAVQLVQLQEQAFA